MRAPSLSWRAAIIGAALEGGGMVDLWHNTLARGAPVEWMVPCGLVSFAAFMVACGLSSSHRAVAYSMKQRPIVVGDLVWPVIIGLPVVLAVGVAEILNIPLPAERVCPHCKERCWAVENGCQKGVRI